MEIYHGLLITILLAGLFIKNKKKVSILIGILLVLVSTFRADTVGADLKNYLTVFYSLPYYSWNEVLAVRWEYGYVVMNKLLSFISTEQWFFQAATSSIIIFCVVVFILKYSPNPAFSLFIYFCYGFYFSSFSLLRMYLAIAITLIAMDCLMKRKIKWFLFYVILASLFHRSALFFILFPIVDQLRKTRTGWIWLWISVVVIYFSAPFLMSFITRFARSAVYGGEATKGSGYNLLIFYTLIIFSIYSLKKIRTYSEISTTYINNIITLMICAIIIQLLSTQHSVFTRAGNYFFVPALLMMPNIAVMKSKGIISIEGQQPMSHFYVICVGTIFLSWYIFMAVAGTHSHGAFPYVSNFF